MTLLSIKWWLIRFALLYYLISLKLAIYRHQWSLILNDIIIWGITTVLFFLPFTDIWINKGLKQLMRIWLIWVICLSLILIQITFCCNNDFYLFFIEWFIPSSMQMLLLMAIIYCVLRILSYSIWITLLLKLSITILACFNFIYVQRKDFDFFRMLIDNWLAMK